MRNIEVNAELLIYF